MSHPRLNYMQYLPKELEHFNAIEASIAKNNLESNLVEFIKLRVSQINGCSFCVRYHTQLLRRIGETDERIDLVAVWAESPCFTDQEKIALKWAESVTQLADGQGVSDDLYDEAVTALSEETLTQITLVVTMINVWNRLAVPFQTDHKYVDDLLKMHH